MKKLSFFLALLMLVSLLCSCAEKYTYENAREYSSGECELDGTINRIEIDWINGSVTVLCSGDTETVSVREEDITEISGAEQLRYYVFDDILHIKFAKNGFDKNTELSKDLTVKLPLGSGLSELDITSVSADITVTDVTTENLSLSTDSGFIKTSGTSSASRVTVTTASGEASLSLDGTVESAVMTGDTGSMELKADYVRSFNGENVNGGFLISSDTAPEEFGVKTASGNAVLSLPSGSHSILVDFSSEGYFKSDFDYSKVGEKSLYAIGNGEKLYTFESTAGSLMIAKDGE